MAGLENLIELIRTTNEVYFITAPERVRAAYILVDDIVELALKTYLQEHTVKQRKACRAALEGAGLLTTDKHLAALDRYFTGKVDLVGLAQALGQNGSSAQANLQSLVNPFGDLRHWSVNDPSKRTKFYEISQEVKDLNPSNTHLHQLLDDAFTRHENRNRMYHDHLYTGWSISDVRCLRALCDLFQLMEALFPNFLDFLHNPQYHTVRCQIGVLRLKLQAEEGRQEVAKPYNDALAQLKNGHQYDLNPRSVEHSIVHTVSDRFFFALRERFLDEIAQIELRIDELNEMIADPHRRRRTHPAELADKSQKLEILQKQLNQIDLLIGS